MELFFNDGLQVTVLWMSQLHPAGLICWFSSDNLGPIMCLPGPQVRNPNSFQYPRLSLLIWDLIWAPNTTSVCCTFFRPLLTLAADTYVLALDWMYRGSRCFIFIFFHLSLLVGGQLPHNTAVGFVRPYMQGGVAVLKWMVLSRGPGGGTSVVGKDIKRCSMTGEFWISPLRGGR